MWCVADLTDEYVENMKGIKLLIHSEDFSRIPKGKPVRPFRKNLPVLFESSDERPTGFLENFMFQPKFR